MDYEKEYKKLKADIEKAYLFAQTDSTKSVLEHILPELKESEDERARKRLIAMCQHYIECYAFDQFNLDGYKEALAWLEKQGTSYTKRDVDDAFVEGMAFAKDELEKQKPTWSEKDESYMAHCIRLINNAEGCSISEQGNAITWLYCLKQRIGK